MRLSPILFSFATAAVLLLSPFAGKVSPDLSGPIKRARAYQDGHAALSFWLDGVWSKKTEKILHFLEEGPRSFPFRLEGEKLCVGTVTCRSFSGKTGQKELLDGLEFMAHQGGYWDNIADHEAFWYQLGQTASAFVMDSYHKAQDAALRGDWVPDHQKAIGEVMPLVRDKEALGFDSYDLHRLQKKAGENVWSRPVLRKAAEMHGEFLLRLRAAQKGTGALQDPSEREAAKQRALIGCKWLLLNQEEMTGRSARVNAVLEAVAQAGGFDEAGISREKVSDSDVDSFPFKELSLSTNRDTPFSDEEIARFARGYDFLGTPDEQVPQQNTAEEREAYIKAGFAREGALDTIQSAANFNEAFAQKQVGPHPLARTKVKKEPAPRASTSSLPFP